MSIDGSTEDLPIALVSAADTTTADSFISEVIDQDSSESGEVVPGRVWQIHNKYYTAQVRLLPASDASVSALVPEAHIIYLTEAECSEQSRAAELLVRRAAGAGAGAGGEGAPHVRLVVSDTAQAPAGLCAAAARHHYELVLLREPPPDEDEDEDRDLCGVQRARAALHAHTWPGLRLRRAAAPPPPPADTDTEEAAVERAELFAEALAALGAVRELPPPARRDHADALLGAFARALGLDDLDLTDL